MSSSIRPSPSSSVDGKYSDFLARNEVKIETSHTVINIVMIKELVNLVWYLIMESTYIALFQLSSKRFDTHYYPDRPGINLKPSQLPGKNTVRLRTTILTISCTVWYQVPFYCRVDRRGYDSGNFQTASEQTHHCTTAFPKTSYVFLKMNKYQF